MAIAEVIKYDGGPEIFAWKYPNEELGTWSQLIVNESQEAILFKGGRAMDVFGAGRHTLSTDNIPILNKIINLPFGGRSPFTAEIWFINKIHSLDIKWGTPTPIQLKDPLYKVMIPLRSYGQFGIRIADGKKFILKLVGTLAVFDKTDLTNYFRGLFLTKSKDSISSYLVNKEVSVLDINAYLDELSNHIKEKIAPMMDEYGIQLINFFVNDISIPEEDPAVIKLKAALAKKAEMDIVGYDYVQERSFNTLEGVATNTGGQSGMLGAATNLAMGLRMGEVVSNTMGQLTGNMDINKYIKCPQCGDNINANKRFCANCGFDTQSVKTEASNSNNTVCDKCGTTYAKSGGFCPKCGDAYNACVNCGADIAEGTKVCPVCKKEIPLPCPKCGALTVFSNTKHCSECGEPLIKKCPNCSALLINEAKFCAECGTKLQGVTNEKK